MALTIAHDGQIQITVSDTKDIGGEFLVMLKINDTTIKLKKTASDRLRIPLLGGDLVHISGYVR